MQAMKTLDDIRTPIPYLRSDLETLRVEFTARNLREELFDRREETVRNGRTADRPPSLGREGFELVRHPCPVVEDRLEELMRDYDSPDESDAKRAYMDETIALLRRLTGARDVFSANSSTIRYSPVLRNPRAMTPAMWAHFDFTAEETQGQLDDVLDATGFTPKPYSRFVLYQGWRALSPPPQDLPLAICDGRTVAPADVVPIEYHKEVDGRDVIYRSCGARFSADHRWWYYPDMRPDEMLLFKGYDSALGEAMKTLHVAIDDPAQDRTVPRISIESRYFVLFD